MRTSSMRPVNGEDKSTPVTPIRRFVAVCLRFPLALLSTTVVTSTPFIYSLHVLPLYVPVTRYQIPTTYEILLWHISVNSFASLILKSKTLPLVRNTYWLSDPWFPNFETIIPPPVTFTHELTDIDWTGSTLSPIKTLSSIPSKFSALPLFPSTHVRPPVSVPSFLFPLASPACVPVPSFIDQ